MLITSITNRYQDAALVYANWPIYWPSPIASECYKETIISARWIGESGDTNEA